MTDRHPNMALFERLDPENLAASKDVFSDDLVWHYFNPKLPDIQGDYVGLAGLQSFFEKVGGTTKGSFKVHPGSAEAFGDELMVMHNHNTMTIDGEEVDIDVAVIWRVVDGRVAEVWDIPSVYTSRKGES